ncbi:uncharacterized protein PHALS_01302 [Plasmopara halstedii]|uniref:Uncharacterized protein n=1 Tax=Plasmopara halstedii TaxID=4781 RepID=A0A0N7L6R1_PLAHL|nr:uncharacterized protein PHALS_01302 [Plasmopara halstedii]CEG44979.1 hypothetical protein PHALS_01302 [Plasmopara halstedii]|eukprot:XP_024581348.1 hypothetical protein PHALS_01302 [Plasmopara halstedii]
MSSMTPRRFGYIPKRRKRLIMNDQPGRYLPPRVVTAGVICGCFVLSIAEPMGLEASFGNRFRSYRR